MKHGRIRKLHVVVVHDGLDRNVPKSVKCDARAELLFCSWTMWAFDIFAAIAVVVGA